MHVITTRRIFNHRFAAIRMWYEEEAQGVLVYSSPPPRYIALPLIHEESVDYSDPLALDPEPCLPHCIPIPVEEQQSNH